MSISQMIELVAVVIIFLGSVMSVISAFGIIRLPDVYTRSHAATKSSTVAVLLSLSGAFIYFWVSENFISVRLILGILFVFLTAPVAGHLLTRAAYRSRVELTENSSDDALKEVLFPEDK
ncbi:Na+/H+ antiporter subunit G [Psychrobacillus sp. INOP01]|nr:Na+/H+ antiporter subunit G [Psychrobacillus sp. INOP01]QUG43308.1 Na+/H+ antiporter subunit G [Psychrobacillus sp. INOP01]